MLCCCFFFFFQAEDGIRDGHVTGVQTCALPIWLQRALRIGLLPNISHCQVASRRCSRRSARPAAFFSARGARNLSAITPVEQTTSCPPRGGRAPVAGFPRAIS